MPLNDVTPAEDEELGRRGLGFLRQARVLRGLSPAAFERIERRLERPAARPRPRPLLLAAATLTVVLLAGTAFAVAHVGLRGLPLLGPLFAPSVPAPAKPVPRRGSAPRKPAAVPPAGVGEPLPSAAAPVPSAPEPAARAPMLLGEPKPAAAAPRKVATARPTPTEPLAAEAPVRPAAPPPENPILAESQSFSAALGRWHRDHDAAAALAALDQHERRFPAGSLAPEARLLRAEILLAQGRERESLSLLDGVRLAGSPRARELFTVRGELRIKLGRCAEGRADLDEVLAKGLADDFARRAAQALAHCP